jgi:aminoacyl tRNA synthase complex-interacting multifunctional protein 1
MRGVKSQGMVLCASPTDGTKVELLAPVDLTKVKPGDRVYFEGMEGKKMSILYAHIAQIMHAGLKPYLYKIGTPEAVLNPKKKYWETVQPDFKTNGETFAYFQDKPFLIKSSSGEDVKVKAASVTDGLIR